MLDRHPRPVEPRTEFELQREIERRATRRLAFACLAFYLATIIGAALVVAQSGGAS